MVGLNPVLRCLMSVEDSLVRGESVRDSIMQWLDRESRQSEAVLREKANEREFQRELLDFLRKTEGLEEINSSFEAADIKCRTVYRSSLLLILMDGLRGSSVLVRLRELRIEIESQLELDMKAHVESLPLKMLVPLLLFMFPAFLILLLGPITRNFVEALK
jgi:hypothetical protein